MSFSWLFREILVSSRWPWFGPGKNSITILIFHEITEPQKRIFRELTEYLKDNFDIISPQDFATYDFKKPAYIFSFDDGFCSQFHIAQEVLNPIGIRAIFFICPDFIGLTGQDAGNFMARNIRLSSVPDNISPYCMPMTWEQVKILKDQSHTIGGHTLSHVCMSSVSDEVYLNEQIVETNKILQDILGEKADWFAYPFGNIDSIDTRSMKVAHTNYKYCCSAIRGSNTPKTRPLALLRQVVELDYSMPYIGMVLKGGLDFLYFLDVLKLKRMAKQVVAKS